MADQLTSNGLLSLPREILIKIALHFIFPKEIALADSDAIKANKYPSENDTFWRESFKKLLIIRGVCKLFLSVTNDNEEIRLVEQARKNFTVEKLKPYIETIISGNIRNFSGYAVAVGKIKPLFNKYPDILNPEYKSEIKLKLNKEKIYITRADINIKTCVYILNLFILVPSLPIFLISLFTLRASDPNFHSKYCNDLNFDYSCLEPLNFILTYYLMLFTSIGSFIGSSMKLGELYFYGKCISPKLYNQLLPTIEDYSVKQQTQIVMSKIYLNRHPILLIVSLICVLFLVKLNPTQLDVTSCITSVDDNDENGGNLLNQSCVEDKYYASLNLMLSLSLLGSFCLAFCLYHIVDKTCRTTCEITKKSLDCIRKQSFWGTNAENESRQSLLQKKGEAPKDPVILSYSYERADQDRFCTC